MNIKKLDLTSPSDCEGALAHVTTDGDVLFEWEDAGRCELEWEIKIPDMYVGTHSEFRGWIWHELCRRKDRHTRGCI